MARMELNDNTVENVVGGAFHYYYKDDGTCTVKIDNVGTYQCSEVAKTRLNRYMMQNPDCTLQDVINYAFDNGLYWN